ncbi:amidohydrolase family protein [Nonomuraea sp. NPDC048916]|uniref:amidohydrolase family protein n=1 Tax=Nonomuraea sp. NPDC048916 TaxID=3154232 RepID=UPI0033DB04AD
MSGAGRIDVHAHGIPKELPDLAARYPGAWPNILPTGPRTADLRLGDTFFRAIDDRCWDTARRLEEMDADGVSAQVVSPIPVTFGYGLPARGAAELARVQNAWIAALVDTAPARFAGLGTVPLQAPDVAAAMVAECVADLRLAGVEIGTNVNGGPLDDPSLDEFYSACAEHGAVLLLHPWQVLGGDRLREHGLLYAVGMPAETAAAAATLILGGVLDRHPGLRIVLSHGGGALLPLLPRLERCVETLPGVRPPNRPVRDYLRRFWYDSLVYDPATLRALVETVGADRVMVGTDYPFPIAERPAGTAVLDAGLDPEAERAILSGTAAGLFGLARGDGTLMSSPRPN